MTAKTLNSKLMVLDFVAAFSAPTEPGTYLIVDDRMQYHVCRARFADSGEFEAFDVIGLPGVSYVGNTVLSFARARDPAIIVQHLYSQAPKAATRRATESLPAPRLLAAQPTAPETGKFYSFPARIGAIA